MIALLSRLFIKDYQNTDDPGVRRRIAVLCSLTGVFLNLLLFAGKYIAGVLSASVAVTADAFNNLSDAGSSVTALVGFSLSGKRPDREHPFGHGRAEYISGLAVAGIILLMGIELGKSALKKILRPEPIVFSTAAVLVLLVSVAVKLYMFAYNRSMGRKLSSAAMSAIAADSLSDAAATAFVLLGMGIARIWGLHIDGWLGLAVSGFILYSGFSAARETLSPLLGQPPSPDFVARIEAIVLSYPEIVGIHDLVVHSYGPGRIMISLHAEVPDSGEFFDLHDAVDLAERRLKETLCCDAVIHMDPVSRDDEETARIREQLSGAVKAIDPRITIHDLRIVRGPTHTNLVFDAVVPHRFSLSDREVKRRIGELVSILWENTYAVVEIDQSYLS